MSKSHLSSKRSFAYALLLLNTILWGLSPPIIKVALNFVSINQFLLGRYLLASLIFLPIYLLSKHKSQIFWQSQISLCKTNLKSQILLVLLALLGTPLTLIPLYEGIKLTSSIESSILSATGPLAIIIGGRIFLKEKITRNEKIGLIIALIGTLILTIGPLISGSSGFKISLLGNFLILGSNIIWTAFLLLVKKLKIDASQISLVSYLVAIPVFFLLTFLDSPQISNLKSQISNSYALFGIFYMAIGGSIIAFWAYTKGQEYIEASEAAIFTYLQPLITFPLAYFWLHESISNIGLAACLLIAAGVYVSEYHG